MTFINFWVFKVTSNGDFVYLESEMKDNQHHHPAIAI